MFNLIDYADFNVRNERDRTDADAKNNLYVKEVFSSKIPLYDIH